MFEKYETKINGSKEREIIIDVTHPIKITQNKIIIFSHGFKGFKDWGPFNKIAEFFASEGFIFIKFNFSYNGTSSDNPVDFVNLNVFGNNNFCIELDDLELVINWVNRKYIETKIYLLGHSRGGAISILKTSENKKIDKVISWASPSDLLKKLPIDDKVKIWKKSNVVYVYNGRTKQNMPMYYQFYKNCVDNTDRLSIKESLMKIEIPHLHIHGSLDPTVPVDDALIMKKWNTKSDIHIINNANHVFDGCHPYNSIQFPDHLMQAIKKTLLFLKSQ